MKLDVSRLMEAVAERLSEKRYRHTLGVMQMAQRIADGLIPERKDEIMCAALLHDIAKEYPIEEQILLSESEGYILTDADKRSTPIIHSFAAPAVIRQYFPEYASEDILSAVFNHTVGSPDMSVFDEIIFLSDFIEENRKYEASIAVREDFISRYASANSTKDKENAVHRACVTAIDLTAKHILECGGYINEKMLATRRALEEKYQ